MPRNIAHSYVRPTGETVEIHFALLRRGGRVVTPIIDGEWRSDLAATLRSEASVKAWGESMEVRDREAFKMLAAEVR